MPARSVAFSADGQYLVSAGNDGFVKVWSTRDWTEMLEFGNEASIAYASFSPDGTRIIAVPMGLETLLWTLDRQSLKRRLEAATTVCIPPVERVENFGETEYEACQAFAKCETNHERSGPACVAAELAAPEPSPDRLQMLRGVIPRGPLSR